MFSVKRDRVTVEERNARHVPDEDEKKELGVAFPKKGEFKKHPGT